MNEHLLKFSITPRVVKADAKQTIRIEGLDESCKFFDDVDYVVKIITKEHWNSYAEGKEYILRGYNNTDTFTCRTKDGVMSFEYFFKGEGEWKINIARADTEKHVPEKKIEYGWKKWLLDHMLGGFNFSIYSLNEDLYNKRPYKGDLHIHSCRSDGEESPAMVAAQYRKYGFDFISITDHYHMDSSFETVEMFENINTQLKLFPGEEVHPIIQGIFHVVNFNGKKSVNKLAHENPEETQKKVLEIAETLDIDDELIRTEVAWFKWINDEIHNAEGISILAHPYWTVNDSFVVRQAVTDEIFKRGLLDAVEIFGGCDTKTNRMQVQMYYHQCAKGYTVPIVSSTDTHSALTHGVGPCFNESWTIAFAEDVSKIPESILAGNAVAVDNSVVDQKNILGNLRLVKYAWFLIENYYGFHDDYCNATGQALLRYVLGDESQHVLVEMLEEELKKFDKTFFG